MKSWSSFRTWVGLDLTGCPNILMDDAIRQAVTEFCETARILKRDADVITIVAFTAEYDLIFSSVEYVPVAIYEAWLPIGVRKLTETTAAELDWKWNSWTELTTPNDPTQHLLTIENKVRLVHIPETVLTDIHTVVSVADNGSGKARFYTEKNGKAVKHGKIVGDVMTHADFDESTYNGSLTITAVSDAYHYDIGAVSFVATDTGTVTGPKNLAVSVYVKPSIDATEIDDFIYDEYA